MCEKKEQILNQDLSLYVHIPFCVKKCLYCDFLSAPASAETQEKYLTKLCEEVRRKAQRFQKYQVRTIFFGGGTPTAVRPESLCRVLETICGNFAVASDAEISLECNPGTASLQTLREYRRAGFNRLSIGLQSADDGLLKTLGRIHTCEQFLRTFAWAREAGFENINVDLMSSLPGQTYAQYEDTLYKVLELKPEHISAYSLIVEEGTPFAAMELDLPSEELDRLMYQRTEEILNDFGYERYEISNYALPGKECRHNLVYWQRGAYLGLGLGAASFYDHTRYKNVSDLNVYLGGSLPEKESGDAGRTVIRSAKGQQDEGVEGCGTKEIGDREDSGDAGRTVIRSAKGQQDEITEGRSTKTAGDREDSRSKGKQDCEREVRHEERSRESHEERKKECEEEYEEKEALTPREEMEEFYFLGLRLMRGVSQSAFRTQFGEDAEGRFQGAIESSIADGLMERSRDGDRLRLTRRGIDVSNTVFVRFLE
ncbi:MAG: radical SAM family heme chaperone HemW [Lachnospiraceae bacterium]|nr:radical SAM family heme chaperone HemW [Lachnospiraceae bacterium]